MQQIIKMRMLNLGINTGLSSNKINQRILYLQSSFKVVNKKIITLNRNPILFYFSQWPRQSKFSKDLGLSSQFQQITKIAQKQEKSKVNIFTLVLLSFICFAGTILCLSILLPEEREKGKLFIIYFMTYFNSDRKIQFLEKVKQFQQQFYSDKPYTNKSINYLMLKFINSNLKQGFYGQQKLLLQIMAHIVNNLAGIKKKSQEKPNPKFTNTTQKLYQLYLQRLILAQFKIFSLLDSQEEVHLSKILSHCSTYGNLKILFLVSQVLNCSKQNSQVFYKRSKPIVLNLQTNLQLHKQRIQWIKNKIMQVSKNDNQRIALNSKVSAQKVFIEPYQYNCRIKQLWILYIEKICSEIKSAK